MTQKTQLLHTQLNKAERRASVLRAKLREVQNSCKHEFPGPPYYFGFGKAPEGQTHHLDSETCVLCGLDCHDPEEWK
jgi:hypothetical protein